MRSTLGRRVDATLLCVIMYLSFTVVFSSQLRNILWGAMVSLPTCILFIYALRLWKRRKNGAWERERNAAHHLHNLMLDEPLKALSVVGELIGEEYGIENLSMVDGCLTGNMDGEGVTLKLLQKPLEAQVEADAVLEYYHSIGGDILKGILISTARYSSAAELFARQCENPRIALLGPDILLNLLEQLPCCGDEPAREEKKRKSARLSRLSEHMINSSRQHGYLLYGLIMLFAYILFDIWTFLFPGLACIFMALISRGNAQANTKMLFPK